MPELPEVETVKRGLAPTMEGAVIVNAELRRPDLRFPFPVNFSATLAGQRIVSLSRRAKYLMIDLEAGDVIIAHLGMSGSFRIEQGALPATPGEFYHPRGKDEKHDHVIFHLESAAGPARVIYNDPRRFGFMDLARRETVSAHAFFRALGEEPTGNALDAAYLAGRFAGKAQPLKAALLDQKNIAGLGNIYVCEALFRAGLHPQAAAGRLATPGGRPRETAHRLAAAIRDVLTEAVEAGGSTLRDYAQPDGELGYFSKSFAVYDREGEACACGGKVKRFAQGGRSTWHCPKCQR